jgi:hypothetical protein
METCPVDILEAPKARVAASVTKGATMTEHAENNSIADASGDHIQHFLRQARLVLGGGIVGVAVVGVAGALIGSAPNEAHDLVGALLGALLSAVVVLRLDKGHRS